MLKLKQQTYDVTISVWNRFHSDHLAKGFIRNGFRVLMLGSVRNYPEHCDHRTSWLSLFLMQAIRFTNKRYHRQLIRMSRKVHGEFAKTHATRSPVFWAWHGFNLPGMVNAKDHGVKVVSEVGSTHTCWQRSILEKEFKIHDLDPELDLPIDIDRGCREWDHADYICVPSRFIAETYIHYGIPPGKLAINPYGVDVEFWQKHTKKAAPSYNNSNELRFVFTGHANLRKGIYYLLNAWKQAALPNAKLFVVGACDSYGAELLKATPRNVIHMGRLSHNSLRELYSQSDIFVFPSLEEGMARSCLEAMASGLPMIITKETGLADVMVEDADGWFVPAADSTALANRLRLAATVDRNKLYRMGQSAQQRASTMTWNAYGDRAATFLENILHERTPLNLYLP